MPRPFAAGVTRQPFSAVPRGYRLVEPVRVLWCDERGFGYETLPGHPLDGEESFLLEAGVFSVRSLSRPASPLWWLLAPALRAIQRRSVRRYLAAVAESPVA